MGKRRYIAFITWLMLASITTVLAVKSVHYHEAEQTSSASACSTENDCLVCAFTFSPGIEDDVTVSAEPTVILWEQVTIPQSQAIPGIHSTFRVRPPPAI